MRSEALAPHWRTCQCGEHGCQWHYRHRGCEGPIRLLLTRDRGGRLWRLADTCRACATVTEHAAEVPEPPGAGVWAPGGSGPGGSPAYWPADVSVASSAELARPCSADACERESAEEYAWWSDDSAQVTMPVW
ncbi:hypothetical protein ACMATS_00160 [Streptoverticillium reticulum]|uniref:hypothetical protein n=1 Tax=Streptoverticillium reticulum TaxID=1433415 RepID=UPI0039BFC0B1